MSLSRISIFDDDFGEAPNAENVAPIRPVPRGESGESRKLLGLIPVLSVSLPPVFEQGRWKNELFACCEDGTLSCYALCCSCNATGQIYQRLTKQPGSCLLIAGVLWMLFIVTQVLNSTSMALVNSLTQCTDVLSFICFLSDDFRSTAAAANVTSQVAALTGLIFTVVLACFLCTSRRRIRTRDSIPAGECGETCDDCCTAYWCGCCSIVQMLRHENITGDNYAPCAVEGETAVELATTV